MGNSIDSATTIAEPKTEFAPLGLTEFSNQLHKLDSEMQAKTGFVRSASFTERSINGKLNTRIAFNGQGTYRFVLISRIEDTLSGIDLVPTIKGGTTQSEITRISDVYLKKEEAYFTANFDYRLANDVKTIDIELNPTAKDISVSDFVLYIFKLED